MMVHHVLKLPQFMVRWDDVAVARADVMEGITFNSQLKLELE